MGVLSLFTNFFADNKGEIPENKKTVANIVGYESDDPTWERMLDDVGFGEMRGL